MHADTETDTRTHHRPSTLTQESTSTHRTPPSTPSVLAPVLLSGHVGQRAISSTYEEIPDFSREGIHGTGIRSVTSGAEEPGKCSPCGGTPVSTLVSALTSPPGAAPGSFRYFFQKGTAFKSSWVVLKRYFRFCPTLIFSLVERTD